MFVACVSQLCDPEVHVTHKLEAALWLKTGDYSLSNMVQELIWGNEILKMKN